MADKFQSKGKSSAGEGMTGMFTVAGLEIDLMKARAKQSSITVKLLHRK